MKWLAKLAVFTVGCVSIAACSGGNAESAGSGSATTSASAGTTATPTVTQEATPTPTPSVTANHNVKDAVTMDKSKFKVLEEPVSVKRSHYVVPQLVLPSGDIFWKKTRRVQRLEIWNPDLFLQTRTGQVKTISRGKKTGDQWQMVASAHSGDDFVWRTTRSTSLGNEDWRISAKRGNAPAKVLVTMEDVDKRIGERQVTIDSDTSVATANGYAVWTVSPAVPYPDENGNVNEEEMPVQGAGLEWWFMDLNHPKKAQKVIVDAAFPTVHNGQFYGFGGSRETGQANTLMRFDPKTGAVEKVLTVDLLEKEKPNSFCASDSLFAIGTSVDDTADGKVGRVIVFTKDGVKDTLATGFKVGDVSCGDNLIGVGEGRNERGRQYLFDLKGEGKVIKIGAHPGFGQVTAAGRHVMWTVPSSKWENRAQYAMARDL